MGTNRGRLDRVEKQVRAVHEARGKQEVGFDRAGHIVEFATDQRFLGMKLFPRQGSLLKAMTLDVEHMTEFDLRVYAEWGAGFVPDLDGDRPAWQGTAGTTPDLMERVMWCRGQGRRWFRETLLLIGRRGSKGYLAAIFGAWQLHVLFCDGDVHERHGADPFKRLSWVVFAGKKDQAVANVFRDFKSVVTRSQWFKPFIAETTKESVLLFTPRQLRDGVDTSDPDLALIEIRAAATTDLDQRGPAVLSIFMDEFAHLHGSGATSSSVDIYNAATPATAQFGVDAAVVQTTSPWDKHGQAWFTYNRALEFDPVTGGAVNPDFLIVQLPSDALYLDADRADTIPMWPGGPTYPGGRGPVFEFDEARLRDEQANPDAFATEYRAQWRSSPDAYLPDRFVDRLWRVWKGVQLAMAQRAPLSTQYFAHADPSLSQANFGFAICHLEWDDDDVAHVVFDVIDHWRPQDFPDGSVSYVQIGERIFDYIRRFNISELTFDHWNSAELMERLNDRVAAARLPKACRIHERRPNQQLNLDVWEMFKTALGHDLVHAPYYQQADLELRALEFRGGRVQAPTAGEIRTRDVADAMVYAFYNAFEGVASSVFARLSGLAPMLIQGPSVPEATLRAFAKAQAPDSHQQLTELTRSWGRGPMNAARRGPGAYNPARGGLYDQYGRRRRNGS